MMLFSDIRERRSGRPAKRKLLLVFSRTKTRKKGMALRVSDKK
jgi:hypothetical protein